MKKFNLRSRPFPSGIVGGHFWKKQENGQALVFNIYSEANPEIEIRDADPSTMRGQHIIEQLERSVQYIEKLLKRKINPESNWIYTFYAEAYDLQHVSQLIDANNRRYENERALENACIDLGGVTFDNFEELSQYSLKKFNVPIECFNGGEVGEFMPNEVEFYLKEQDKLGRS